MLPFGEVDGSKVRFVRSGQDGAEVVLKPPRKLKKPKVVRTVQLQPSLGMEIPLQLAVGGDRAPNEDGVGT